MDYSTNEINTGAKWIDGSAIYKKTVNFGTLPNTTDKTVNHGISNLGWVIKIEMIARRNDGIFFPIPFASHHGSANSIDVTADSTSVVVATGMDRSNLTESYITLYYTKSS